MPNCREVARLTSEALDHPLPLGLRLRLSLHRRLCAWCARYARQLAFLHDAARHASEHLDHLPGPALPDEARARMKQALRIRGEKR